MAIKLLELDVSFSNMSLGELHSEKGVHLCYLQFKSDNYV